MQKSKNFPFIAQNGNWCATVDFHFHCLLAWIKWWKIIKAVLFGKWQFFEVKFLDASKALYLVFVFVFGIREMRIFFTFIHIPSCHFSNNYVNGKVSAPLLER